MAAEKRQQPNHQVRRQPSSSRDSLGSPSSIRSQILDDDDDDDLPPSYTMAPSTPDPSQLRTATLGRLIPGNVPNVNFAAYAPLGSQVSSDMTTTTIVDSALCSSPQAFAKVITEQIALIPVPEIRIKGTRNQYGRLETDFDIRMNMMRYFLPKDGSANSHYTNLVSSGKDRLNGPGIEDMARSFCTNSASDKRFIITRKLTNWDSETIIGRIHGLCQQVNYKGNVTVTIPISHSRTVIKTTQGLSAVFKAHFVAAEKYEIDVFWPYASHVPTTDSDEEQPSDIHNRKCLIRTENGWFKDWRPVLRAAILNKKVGWLGLEDWIEYQMKPVKSESTPAAWGEH